MFYLEGEDSFPAGGVPDNGLEGVGSEEGFVFGHFGLDGLGVDFVHVFTDEVGVGRPGHACQGGGFKPDRGMAGVADGNAGARGACHFP